METAQLNEPRNKTENHPGGALTPSFLGALRDGYRMDSADRARHNAVTGQDGSALALDRRALSGGDAHFSHLIRTGGITNQKKSGRCWMFAGLNMLRPSVIAGHRMEEFEFSSAYLQFWDKLEKSNLYLESVIELRDSHFLDREWEGINKVAVEDGGWWNYFAGLVRKYGVVPGPVMPETHASNHTSVLNEVLGRLLRSRAVRMLDQYADGANEEELRDSKRKALAEVYRLLVIHLGEPPVDFEWRHTVRKESGSSSDTDQEMRTSENSRLTPPQRYTPQSFYSEFVGRSLNDFVCLYNDPKNEMMRHCQFDRARNIVGDACMSFANIQSSVMKDIAKRSILANQPLWFAVNMGFDQSSEHGLMKHQLFDYETFFDIDLKISKADRTRFHSGASGHAMALMGVDLDSTGNPRKWLVENSWGDDKGNKGRWTLYDDWFDEHVYTIIVHRDHVPADILALFDLEPVSLPSWYPGAMGVQFS